MNDGDAVSVAERVPEGAVLVADERVRTLAEEILARPAYGEFRRDPTELQAFVGRFADWLRETFGWLPDRIEENWEYIEAWLLEVFEGFAAAGPLAGLFRFVLAALVLAAVVASGLVLVRGLRRRLGGEPVASALLPSAGAGEDRIAEADGLAGEGRFLEAAHCTQLATLELLLRREWISLERSDPNRTLRRRLDAGKVPGAERAEFLALLDRLESRWFRDRAEDRDLYGAWRRLYGRLETKALAP